MITRIDGTRQIIPASITNQSQNFGTPVNPGDVAIKSYVDGVAQGLSVKQSVTAISNSPLSPANTYTTNTLTANSNGTLTIDGYTPVLNDRVLVNGEASALKNGIYYVSQVGDATHPYILTRTSDMNLSNQFTGAFAFVEEGTTYADSGWVCTAVSPNVGTDPISFTQFTGTGQITAGNGLQKVGNTLSIDTSITVDKNTTQTLTNKTLTSPVLNSPSMTTASTDSLVLSSFLNEAQGADIASNATTPIGAATGNYVNVTGTTTITAFDTVQAGTRRIVKFTGVLTLTYNSTSLILPGAANITTAAGDVATFVSLGSGNWICVNYQTANRQGTGAQVFANSPTLTTPNIGAATGLSLSVSGQLTSTVSTGTAPLVVSSTTQVANLKAQYAGLADTVTTNANLTGDVTSVGNATTLAVYMRATTITGTQNGVNESFSIGNTVKTGSEQVFFNGQLLTPGSSNDYVLSGTTLTFQSGFSAPQSTDVIRVYGVY